MRNTESRKQKIEVRSESGICRTGECLFTMASAEMRAGANERYMLIYVFCMSEVNNSSCGLMDKAPHSFAGSSPVSRKFVICPWARGWGGGGRGGVRGKLMDPSTASAWTAEGG